MNNLSKISLAVTLGLSTLLVATGSFADEKSSEYEAMEDRKAFRELKREHRQEMKEMRRAHHAGKMLKKVDANQDGKVDLDEYLAHAQERFNKLDLDGSGFVTLEEAQEAMQKMREEHKARRKEMREKYKEDTK